MDAQASRTTAIPAFASSSSSRTLFLAMTVSSTILYLLCLAVYRLYFHPIAHFPGPKLAGLTRWYEFYYELVLKGQMTFHIQELHRKYGRYFVIVQPTYSLSQQQWQRRTHRTDSASSPQGPLSESHPTNYTCSTRTTLKNCTSSPANSTSTLPSLHGLAPTTPSSRRRRTSIIAVCATRSLPFSPDAKSPTFNPSSKTS